MAKKKKQTKKRKTTPEPAPKEQSAFWPLTGAILMLVIALFLLLGSFGTGGALPKGMYSGVYWALGWAAILAPFALVFWGVLKFKSEDKKIPLPKLLSMFGFIVCSASFFTVLFASKNALGAYHGGHGGGLGQLVGGTVLGALDTIPASILFFVLSLLLFFLTFGISPKVLLKPFQRPKRQKDTDIQDLKAKATESGLKLNEGVPVEHHDEKPSPRLSTFRNTAQALTPAESHSALTTASDPDWQFPGIDLLNQKQDKADAGDFNANAQTIKSTFANFGVEVEMDGVNIGPRVTQYTLKPATGVKLTKITALEDNLALDLAAHHLRMEAPIPGKGLVGIEVPNVRGATVRLSSIINSKEWQQSKSPLSFAVGKDIAGKPIIADLSELPHLLVAGQTKSGKSVMINTILTSLLYRNSPADLKLILIDPKLVELKPYDDIPHLLAPVITDAEKTISALKWTVAEMERRYKTLSAEHCRDIFEYNALKKEEGMPQIVVVIDELADLMMMAARDIETLIVRIAQKARAVGIHLILATQSPRVTVITGLIKANVPARIAFTVSQEVESRIILDQGGAEKLLGKGDMLLLTSDMPKSKRIQGALITGEETIKITGFLREQRKPQYDLEVVSQPVTIGGRGNSNVDTDTTDDPQYKEAVRVVIEAGKASTSLLQRRLRIGYGKAARMIENMEEQGIIGPPDGQRPREVLVSSVDDVFGNASASQEDVYDDMPDDGQY